MLCTGFVSALITRPHSRLDVKAGVDLLAGVEDVVGVANVLGLFEYLEHLLREEL